MPWGGTKCRNQIHLWLLFLFSSRMRNSWKSLKYLVIVPSTWHPTSTKDCMCCCLLTGLCPCSSWQQVMVPHIFDFYASIELKFLCLYFSKWMIQSNYLIWKEVKWKSMLAKFIEKMNGFTEITILSLICLDYSTFATLGLPLDWKKEKYKENVLEILNAPVSCQIEWIVKMKRIYYLTLQKCIWFIWTRTRKFSITVIY